MMNSSVTLLIICGVIAVAVIPLILKLVPPNRFYGFRTKRTISDPDLWFRANQFAGWALLIAAAISAALAFLPTGIQGNPTSWTLELLVPLFAAVVACIVYLKRI